MDKSNSMVGNQQLQQLQQPDDLDTRDCRLCLKNAARVKCLTV